MKINHIFNELSAEKEAEEDAGFMLTDKSGSYAFLRENPSSRYEGLFLFDSGIMYKTIENINVKNRGALRKIKNKLYCVERNFSNAAETFFMPRNSSSMIYELDKAREIEIFLDFKDSYDNKEFGRYYDIFWEDNCMVIRFTKRTDRLEDPTSGMEQYSLYLAISSDASNENHGKAEHWVQRHYDFDEKRNSGPFFRHVFHALDIFGKKFVFSMSRDKSKAIEQAQNIFHNLGNVKENEKSFFHNAFSDKAEKIKKGGEFGNEIALAYLSCLNSLDGLALKSGNIGILAGLPWFFQTWSRDEAISLSASSKIDNNFAGKLIRDRLGKIQENGRLPRIYYKEYNDTNADAIGWIFNRAFNFKDKIDFLESLKKSIQATIQNYYGQGLISNGCKETWMDTEACSAGRPGFNIEVQALALSTLKCAYSLTNDAYYKKIGEELKSNVLAKFWNGDFLADNLDHKFIRPNLFLAYCLYPELMPRNDWEKCFDNALEALWLDFGGLSTIDKRSPLFLPSNTGEDPRSYHNGDSWFWINNLAAVAMIKLNKKKYDNYVRKILDASTKDILWEGIIGSHSELSSAEKLEAAGCLNQAWSNAMYVELVDEIIK